MPGFIDFDKILERQARSCLLVLVAIAAIGIAVGAAIYHFAFAK